MASACPPVWTQRRATVPSLPPLYSLVGVGHSTGPPAGPRDIPWGAVAFDEGEHGEGCVAGPLTPELQAQVNQLLSSVVVEVKCSAALPHTFPAAQEVLQLPAEGFQQLDETGPPSTSGPTSLRQKSSWMGGTVLWGYSTLWLTRP